MFTNPTRRLRRNSSGDGGGAPKGDSRTRLGDDLNTKPWRSLTGAIRRMSRRTRIGAAQSAGVDTGNDGHFRESEAHLPAVSQGRGSPLDETHWCIELGRAIRRCKAVLDSARRRRHGRHGEAEIDTALRTLIEILERPLTSTAQGASATSFTVRDQAAGVEFESWTDGMAVGFRCTHERDALHEYIYLVPSDGWAGGVGMVSVFRGTTGVPGRDHLVHWYPLGLPTPAAGDGSRPDAA